MSMESKRRVYMWGLCLAVGSLFVMVELEAFGY